MNSLEILERLQTIHAVAIKIHPDIPAETIPDQTVVAMCTNSRQENHKSTFTHKWKDLYTTIVHEGSEKSKIEHWLNQIKDNFDNIHKLSNRFPDKDSSNTVEQLLLPICQLIHVYEQNGDPKDHAKKLGRVFATFEDALNYLCIFAKQNIRQYAMFDHMQLIHNACLFTLPEDFDFKKNSKIQKLVKDHMQDPEFRSLLPNLPEIEKLTPQPNKSKPILNPNKTLLSEKIENIRSIIKNYKEIKDKLNKHLKITLAEKNTYDQYSNELLNAQIDLTQTSFDLGNTLDELSIYELKAYNAIYKNNTGSGYKYFLDHGLTNKNYLDLLNLTRIDDDNRIPPIIINGADIGYPGTYLRRLNVQSSFNDAIMAACLGKLSGCCQSLSGEAGEPCTIHGLTSPDGGFYVVCNGDVTNPKLEDPLICQSWVWRSTSNALVIDSIEAKADQIPNNVNPIEENLLNAPNIAEEPDDEGDFAEYTDDDLAFDEIFNAAPTFEQIYNIPMIKAFYMELAYKLISEYNIPKICCGKTYSGITLSIVETSQHPHYEIPIGYNRYRDSYFQEMICDKDSLYLLPNKEDYFFQRCKLMQLQANSLIFLKMISFAINYNREDLLNKYVDLFSVNNQGKVILKKIREYLQSPDLITSLSEINKDPYLLPARINGINILHCLVEQEPKLFTQLIDKYTNILIPQHQIAKDILLAAITDQHPNTGNNLLHITANKPELLKQLLKIFPSNHEAILAIEQNNADLKDVLSMALRNDGSLNQILEYYPLESRLQAIGVQGQIAVGVLSWSMMHLDLLLKILTLLPPQDRIKAITPNNIENINGICTLIVYINDRSKHFELVYQILRLFPEKDLLKIFNTPTIKGTILDQLHLLDWNSFKKILELVPIEERVQLITKKNQEGKTILEYFSSSSTDLLTQILDLLPTDEKLKLQIKYFNHPHGADLIFSNYNLQESPKPGFSRISI